MSTWSTASTTSRQSTGGQGSRPSRARRTRPDDHGRLGPSGYVGCKLFGILDGPKHSHPVKARYGGRTGTAPGLNTSLSYPTRSDRPSTVERVVTLWLCGIDVDDLGVDPDIEPESIEETLGRLQEQVVLVLDHPAHEIRESAIGIGDMARSLDDRDLGLLVEASEASGRRHSAGDATDDHDSVLVSRQASPFTCARHEDLLNPSRAGQAFGLLGGQDRTGRQHEGVNDDLARVHQVHGPAVKIDVAHCSHPEVNAGGELTATGANDVHGVGEPTGTNSSPGR